jgi:hypothetical protein
MFLVAVLAGLPPLQSAVLLLSTPPLALAAMLPCLRTSPQPNGNGAVVTRSWAFHTVYRPHRPELLLVTCQVFCCPHNFPTQKALLICLPGELAAMSFMLEPPPWTWTEAVVSISYFLIAENITDRILSTIWWYSSPVGCVDDSNKHKKYKHELYSRLVEWGWCLNTHVARAVGVWCAVSVTRLIQPRDTVFPLCLVPSILWLAQCRCGSPVSGNILSGVCVTWPSHWCTKRKFITDFIITLTLW